MKTPDLYQQRIDHITEYLELGKQLTGIVDNAPDKATLEICMSGLEQLMQAYRKGLQATLDKQEAEKAIDVVVDEYAQLINGGRMAARQQLENLTVNAGQNARAHSRKAHLYRILYGVVFPFLPTLAQKYEIAYQGHLELRRINAHLHKNAEETRRINESTLRIVYQNEHGEGRRHEHLRSLRFSEMEARGIVERPETLYHAIISIIKDKCAP